MHIYTKFGDQGNTQLLGGSVVPKNDLRVEAYGSVDELNSVLGIVVAFCEVEVVKTSLNRIQHDLFAIGSELASKSVSKVILDSARISALEAEIDSFEKILPPLSNFILPGGSKAAALLHHARTVCRRSERSVVSLSQHSKINPDIITYMNRVGDLLFTQARYVNLKKGAPEILWSAKRP